MPTAKGNPRKNEDKLRMGQSNENEIARRGAFVETNEIKMPHYMKKETSERNSGSI